MGALAKILLQLLAGVTLLAIGFYFPSALANVLSWLDATIGAVADNAEPTGTVKLILQFAGAGFAVVMGALVIITGFAMRQFVSHTFFRWQYVLTAGLIPLLAHVVKWGLGLWWPTLLVPVHSLIGLVYNWFSAETQIQLDLFNFKGHFMIIILSLVLIMLWSLITFIWRLVRGRKASAPSPSPQPPSGNRWSDSMKTILNWGWRLVTFLPRLVWRAISWPFNQDIILGPISWTAFVVFTALAIGYGFSLLIAWLGNQAVLNQTLTQNPFSGIIQVLISILMAIILLQPEWDETAGKIKVFSVPGPAKGAQLTWLGMVTPFVLETGSYPILGRFLGFGWLKIEPTVTDGKEVPRTIADKDGFIILGDITFQVWNSAGATTKAEQTTITLPAKNTAPVSGSLSFVLTGRKRIRWVNASDTGLELGNRARQELQEILEWFVDTDVKSMLGHMLGLFTGSVLVTCMMPKDVGRFKTGSMIRDEQGKPMFRIVSDPTEASIKKAIADFISKDLMTSADPDMLKVVTKKVPGGATEIQVSSFKAENSILDVIIQRGFRLARVMYDSVRMSPEVELAAKQASSEADERTAQLASARANVEARQILMPTAKEMKNPEAWQFATALQAANDSKNGGVRIVLIPGAGPLSRELVSANLVTGVDK